MKLALAVPLVVFLAALGGRAQDLPPEPDDHDHSHADPRPRPALDIQVRVDEVKDVGTGDILRTIRGSGTCGYPEGTTLILEARLKGAPGFLDKRHATFVDPNGGWDGALDDLGRQIYKGLYEVRVTFDPQFQPASVMSALDKKNLRADIQSKSAEVRIGTPEEEAREKADVDQMFARSFATARGVLEKTAATYEKQLKEPDRLAWGDFVDDMNSTLVKGDRELADYYKSRDNMRDTETYEKISSLYAISSTLLFPALSAALGVDGGRPSDDERETAKTMLAGLKRTIDDLSGTLGQVKIDPGWKPLDPRPVRVEQPKPPVGPIDPLPPQVPGPQGPKPLGRGVAPASRFGLVEFGIGLAAMCAAAMLVVLLRRK